MRGIRIVCAFTAAVATTVVLLGPTEAMMLEAQVEHSEHMQPVNAALAPGELFDPNKLPLVEDSGALNRWYKVPQWLAGKWHKDSQTNYYRFDYTTGQTDVTTTVEEAKSENMWGTQIDPAGQVWQFDATPFVTTVDAGDQIVVQVVKFMEPVEVTDAYFVRRSVDTQLRVDKATNVIKTVESGEQLITYIPDGLGLIKREASAKVFDRFGKPTVLGKSFSYEKRVGEFAAQNTYQGKDLRTLFMQFLNSLQKASRAKTWGNICSDADRPNLTCVR